MCCSMHIAPASFDPHLIKGEISQNSKAKNHMIITRNAEFFFQNSPLIYDLKKKGK